MRAHPVYTAFHKRWQIHTYFQLRWKEIVVKFEESLAPTKLDIIKGVSLSSTVDLNLPHVFRQRPICHKPGNCGLERYFYVLE